MGTLPWYGDITLVWEHYPGMGTLPWYGDITLVWALCPDWGHPDCYHLWSSVLDEERASPTGNQNKAACAYILSHAVP